MTTQQGETSRLSESVSRFIRSVERRDTTEVLRMIASASRHAIAPGRLAQLFFDNTKDFQERGGIRAIKVHHEESDGKNAAVDIEMTYGDGTTERETIDLRMEGEAWKIDVAVVQE